MNRNIVLVHLTNEAEDFKPFPSLFNRRSKQDEWLVLRLEIHTILSRYAIPPMFVYLLPDDLTEETP